jgi:RND family efflux transporter MFP subunit
MNKVIPTAALLASLAMLAACQEKEEHEAPPVRPVLSMVISPVTADATRFTGTIQSRYISELGFQIAGRLVRRDVSVGDVVAAGQKLAELDPLSYQLQLRIAEAELQSAVAQRQNAVTNESREKSLLSQNVSSQANFDAAKQARESADANVESATAKVAKAKEQLSNTLVTSTFAGVVTEVTAEPGQIVQAGQKVLTLARPDVREAVVDVPERIGRVLKVGAGFDVVSQAQASLKSVGHVREIAPLADATTRTLRVRISLDEPPPGFRLGSIITATISTPVEQTLLLPSSAVLDRDGKTFVWIVETGTVSTREVEVAPQGTWLRVTKGLSQGDRVVTAGVHSLAEGQKVKLSDEAAQ